MFQSKVILLNDFDGVNEEDEGGEDVYLCMIRITFLSKKQLFLHWVKRCCSELKLWWFIFLFLNIKNALSFELLCQSSSLSLSLLYLWKVWAQAQAC